MNPPTSRPATNDGNPTQPGLRASPRGDRHERYPRISGRWILASLALGLLLSQDLAASPTTPRVPKPTVHPNTGDEVIVIAEDWKERYPFSERFPDLGSGKSRSARVIDLAAQRFATDGLIETGKSGKRRFLEPDLRSFSPELVRQPFESSDRDFFIVQAASPSDQTGLRATLEDLGIAVRGYVPRNGYLVWLSNEQHQALGDRPDVFWTGYFQPAWRVAPKLDYVVESKADHPLRLTALFELDAYESTDALRSELERGGFEVLEVAKSRREWRVRLRGVAADAHRLALLHGCSWVERFSEARPLLDVARTSSHVATGRVQGFNLVIPGPILDVEDVWARGLRGQGQIVGIADTGLSTGNLATLHKDFGEQGPGDPLNPIRLLQGVVLNQRGTWGERPGDSHGTHVAGTILGNGHQSGGLYSGIAPEAEFIFQALGDANGKIGVPVLVEDLVWQDAYDAGARVHNNSWGAAVSGAYDAIAAALDEFLWNHPRMVVTVAAGGGAKDGDADGVVDADGIFSPGTAKNGITVGSSENYRPDFTQEDPPGTCVNKTWGDVSSTRYPAEPLHSDPVADHAIGLAANSARGPTDDSRFKPDLVAPGTAVISTRSGPGFQHLSDGDCKNLGSLKDDYVSGSGTSVASALAAGAATVVRQYFKEGFHSNGSLVTDENRGGDPFEPTAALVKATLIHGASDLYPGQFGEQALRTDPVKIGIQEIPPLWDAHLLPNNAQGYGRVDLEAALFPGSGFEHHPARVMQVYDVAAGLQTLDEHLFPIFVSADDDPLIVTLVWTDPRPLPQAGLLLVNDLDLWVTAPDGTIYIGNDVNRKTSDPDLFADGLNNVEQVKITPSVVKKKHELANGNRVWEVKVKGLDVAGNGQPGSDAQPYALLISGILAEPAPGSSFPAPDLEVEDLDLGQVVFSPGESFTVDATVSNVGAVSSGDTTLGFYLSDNQRISVSDARIGSAPVASPDGGEPVTATLTAPTAPGTWWLGACVEAVGGEIHRENQCTALGTEVTVLAVTPFPATEVARRTAEELAAGDLFGSSVAISGDIAAVGAPRTDSPSGDAGSVRLFERGAGGWIPGATLTPDDGASGDRFGTAVAIRGDTLLVGSPADDDSGFSSGSAYVFDRDASGSWIQTSKLSAGEDAASKDFFGRSLAVSGTVAIVGAPGDDEGGSAAGAAYVFELQDGAWTGVAKLKAEDPEPGDLFGSSVAVDGGVAIVGAYADDDAGSSSGSAYVFERDALGAWHQAQKLTAGGRAEAGDRFGIAVAIDGETAVVGAPLSDQEPGFGWDYGAAYVFDRDAATGGWAEIRRLTPGGAQMPTFLGAAVAIAGDTVIAGAYSQIDVFTNRGAAYVYERDAGGAGAWGQVRKLTAGDESGGDQFGAAVAIADVAVVGAPRDDDAGPSSDSGSVYFFAPCADGDGDGVCD